MSEIRYDPCTQFRLPSDRLLGSWSDIEQGVGGSDRTLPTVISICQVAPSVPEKAVRLMAHLIMELAARPNNGLGLTYSFTAPVREET
jgi:hypothetical protein